MPYDYERITFLLENIIGVEQAVQLRPEQVFSKLYLSFHSADDQFYLIEVGGVL